MKMVESFKSHFKEVNLSQCCGKIPTTDDVQHIRDSITKKIEEESREFEKVIDYSREQQKNR